MSSGVRRRRDQLLRDLIQAVASDPRGRAEGFDVGLWAEKLPLVLDGRPFSFKGHAYLRQPYADNHPHVVWMKAAQMGCTTWALIRAIYLSRRLRFRGVLYLFPSRSDVLDFSKSRLAPLLEENQQTIGAWVQETNAAGLKRIGRTFFYLRGMISRVGLKSIPADMVIFDELDEAPQSHIEVALERLAHSEHKLVVELSNPTLPDYGIHRSWMTSDRHWWFIRCQSCGHWTCLEQEVPDDPHGEIRCLREKDGRVYRACARCGAEIDPEQGEWVAEHPEVKDRRGYTISQLCSAYVDPGRLLKELRESPNPSAIYNLKLGRPYVEPGNRLSREEVLALCSDYLPQDRALPGQVCTMGVDQGRELHVVITDISGPRAVYLGVCRDFGELYHLMDRFHVSLCVIDAQPEVRLARRFAEAYRGRVYRCYYSDSRMFGAPRWDDHQLTVTVNRTESLDHSGRELADGRYLLPRRDRLAELFATHAHNLARKLEEDEDGARYVYVKLGPDHYRHAHNYDAIARSRLVRAPVHYETVLRRRDPVIL